MWQNLIETLDGLSETYDSLVNLGERKRAALVSIDAKSLSEILDEEHIFIAKFKSLSKIALKFSRTCRSQIKP